MATAQQWNAVVGRLVAGPVRWHGPDFEALYALACEDGERMLARRCRMHEGARDLIHDVLAVKLGEILAADHPRASFLTILRNQAISGFRHENLLRTVDLDEASGKGDGHSESARVESIDRKNAVDAVFSGLSRRDRDVVLDGAEGTNPAEIAAQQGLSKDNVYQIISRTRKRLKDALQI